MKKEKTPSLVISATLTLITAIFWIFFSLVKAITQKPSLNIPKEVVEPFSPDLDQNVLANIQKRVFFEQSEAEVSLPQTPSPSPTSTLNPTPSAVPSPTPGQTETPAPEETPEI